MSRTATAAYITSLVILLLLLPQAAAHAATWFVSPTGNDNNAGDTLGTPLATVTEAASRAGDGDTVTLVGVQGESFVSEYVIIDTNNLTITSYKGWPVTSLQLRIDSDGVTVSNLSFQGPSETINLTIYGDDCTVRSCFFSDGGDYYESPIFVLGDNCTFDQCSISGVAHTGLVVGNWQGPAVNFTMTDCTFTDIRPYPIEGPEGSWGEGIAVKITDAVSPSISDCTFTNCTTGILVEDCSYGDFNNLRFLDDLSEGIVLGDLALANTIRNSTFSYGSAIGAWAGNGVELHSPAHYNTIANCLFEDLHTGVDTHGSWLNTITQNTFGNSFAGIAFSTTGSGNEHFRNVFIYLEHPIAATPTTPSFHIGSRLTQFVSYNDGDREVMHKVHVGNIFLPFEGPDADNDGIRDTPETAVAQPGVRDDYPQSTGIGYTFHTWYVAHNSLQYTLSNIPYAEAMLTLLPADSMHVYSVTFPPTNDGMDYQPGSKARKTTWNGRLTFGQALDDGYTMVVEVGHASAADGADFMPVMSKVITGDGLRSRFEFAMDPVAMSVAPDRVVSLRLTNPGDRNIPLLTGGAHSMVSAAHGRDVNLAPITKLLIP